MKSGCDFREFSLIDINFVENSSDLDGIESTPVNTVNQKAKWFTTFEKVDVTKHFSPDPELEEATAKYYDQVEDKLQEVIGATGVEL